METNLSYPIGKFAYHANPGDADRAAFIADFRELPARLRAALSGLDRERLDTPYRDGGWTVRQVVHHLADSHMNAFVRCKLVLTEENPRIKPYNQDAWAALPDGKTAEIEASLSIIEGMHARLTLLLEGLAPSDWARSMDHPERGLIGLDYTLQLYAWHCRHHVAHITGLRRRKGW
jgi:hypothetical protein